jgi:hypothetical protein
MAAIFAANVQAAANMAALQLISQQHYCFEK